MQLRTLTKSINLSLPVHIQDFEVKGITSDSRRIQENFIFVAIEGEDFDGHNFINDAIKRGARLVITQKQIPRSSDQGICHKVDNVRRALADLSAAFWGYPSSLMKLVGITGTNGKTTVSYLIEAILKFAQFNSAVIGTINYRFKNTIFNASNTTPGSEQLQSLFDQIQKEKIEYVVIEVSSHALAQERVSAVNFSAAIFTNLAQDHLDYHHNLNSYFAAKSRLFKDLPKSSYAILNIDDAHTPELIRLTKAHTITYGLSKNADIVAEDLNFSLQGTEFILHLSASMKTDFTAKIKGLRLNSSLIGRHNVYNILAAISFALTQKIEPEIIQEAIQEFAGVPGRLERISIERDFTVFVDYAHTEDALRSVISSLRSLCKGQLCVVFGCGGSRDKTKRPKMGRVVSELADQAIITTDNPRTEEPEEIIKDIIAGINKQNFRVVIDRREAIKEALSLAGKDDIILIAGKGDEQNQIFIDKIIHFDDREVVREYLLPKR